MFDQVRNIGHALVAGGGGIVTCCPCLFGFVSRRFSRVASQSINTYLRGTPDDVVTWFAGFRMAQFAENGPITERAVADPPAQRLVQAGLLQG